MVNSLFTFTKVNSKYFIYFTLFTFLKSKVNVPPLIVIDRFSRNTIVERLFSASKNIITDKMTNLHEDKLDKLLFLKRNLFILKEIKKKELIIHHAHPKRRLSVTDIESA